MLGHYAGTGATACALSLGDRSHGGGHSQRVSLWVVERDAVDAHAESSVDQTLADMLDSAYIEHDTHTLFALIMRTAKSFFAPADPSSNSKETPMLARSSKIFDSYLPKADPELRAHLVKLDIVPQIFLL